MKFTKLAFILLGLVSISSANHSETRRILGEEELALEHENRDYPALHTRDYRQSSYLRWWCMPSQNVARITCLSERENELTACDNECDDELYYTVAETLDALGPQRLEWSVPVFGKECLGRALEWTTLLKDSPSVCFYAAPWPTTDPAYWVVYGIKTSTGRSMAPRYDPEYVEEEAENSSGFEGEDKEPSSE